MIGKSVVLACVLCLAVGVGIGAAVGPPIERALSAQPAVTRKHTVLEVPHAVAQLEITLAKISLADAGLANDPEAGLLDAMSYPAPDSIDWTKVPPDQVALFRDVAMRLSAADSAYNQLFFAREIPMSEYDHGAIIEAAALSAAHDDPAAQAALEEIARWLKEGRQRGP